MKPDEKKSVPIELPVWREMQHEKTESGLDMYELVREGWEAYKQRKHAPRLAHAPAVPAPTNARHAPWQRLLTLILDSGDSEIIQAIQQNLKAFSRIVQLSGEKPEKNRRAGGR